MEDDLAPVEQPSPVEEAKPASLMEAMFPEPSDPQAENPQAGMTATEVAESLRGKGPRDPQGKFVPKTAADTTPAAPQAKPVEKAPEVKPDDLAMPDGLSAKAQQRFQALANEVKTLRESAAPVQKLTEELDMTKRQVEYVKTTFHEHGIRPEQFEQAASVIGMLNRGDLAGAQKVLENQLQQISLMTGKPVGQIDALANFPDLREAVDGLQITEQHALELARARAQRFAGERQAQQEQQARQQTQAEQQSVQAATKAVDDFCKKMQASDVDYQAVEEQLLPEIPNLLRGVPPAQWKGLVETQYRLLKSAAGRFRQTATPSNALRPTGQASPGQAPRTMQEAMWGA